MWLRIVYHFSQPHRRHTIAVRAEYADCYLRAVLNEEFNEYRPFLISILKNSKNFEVLTCQD